MLLMPLTGSDTKLLLSAAQQLTTALFPSPHLWIHEGLASYAQARLIQEKQSRQAAINYLQAHRTTLVDLEKVSREANSNDDSLISSVDDFRVQTKAMYVWWMLRDMVGENALETALHSYKAADDNDPRYMEKSIEGAAHRDLQWFFDDWVYHDRGLPDFRVASVYPSRLSTGGYMVTVTVENLGAAGAEIPVTLHMQGSEASDRLIVPGKSKASVRIQTPSLPLDATLNDGSVPENDTSNDVYKMESGNH
jgi:aminopeptidase N